MSSKLSEAWQRVSLRTKLTSLSVSLIAVLVIVSSFGTISLLRTYLQKNVDTMLESTVSALSHEDPLLLEQRLRSNLVELPRLPSDYYIAYLDNAGNKIIGLVSSTQSNPEVPNLSGFTISKVLQTKAHPFEVNMVSQSGAKRNWRMLAVPLLGQSGSLVVALPNQTNDALLDQYRAIGTGFGLLLLIFSGLAIWLTITSALRPLREVERTAQAVAEGDISKRLIELPGDTEMTRLSRSLNTMLSSIENAFDSRTKTIQQMRRFVSDASHELRTPLVSVRGYAELYRMGAIKKPKDVASAMERIEAEAVRMSELVESLLKLARLDENQKLDLASVDIVALARTAAQDASVAYDNRRILLIDLEGSELPVSAMQVAKADAGQLRQVFTNLIANACRFSPDQASVEIAIGNTSEGLVVEVRDHGEGIPPQLRDKVFERFFRADNSRNRNTGGSGLGLSIVKTILDHHGAKISVQETAGGGATFRMVLKP